MFELRRRNMDNRVRDKLALSAKLNPLNPRRPTLRTNCPRRDHNVLAAHTPHGHQFAIRTLPIELFDCRRREFAQFSSTPEYVNYSGGAGSA
jgi:hypothetical protein